MKLAVAAIVVCLSAFVPAAWADSADDRYVGIFNLIQQADALKQSGQSTAALARYAQAQTELKRFQNIYPAWNVKVIDFRLTYLDGKIAELAPKSVAPPTLVAPATKTAVAEAAPPTPPVTPPPTPVVAVPPPDPNETKIKGLEEQVQRLQSDNSALLANKILMEAKIREAFAVQPAAADAREYAKAQEQIRQLEKRNDLLAVSLAEARNNRMPADTTELDKTRESLNQATKRIAELTAANVALLADRDALQTRVKAPVVADASMSALQQENEILKKQMAELKARPAASTPDAELNRKLQEAQAQLAAMQSDREVWRLEKVALEERVRRMSAGTVLVATAAVATDPASAEKIRQLEGQRDELQKKLDGATKEIAANKKDRETAVRAEEMGRELTALRGRIEVLEARRVPYTEEELSLLSKPGGPMMVASLHSSRGGSRPASELPGNGATLLAEARRHYSAGELDQAEANYQDLVKLDDKNVAVLADLASIQVERNHLDDAEKTIKTALQQSPDNEYCLFVLGRVKFQQDKYDDALDAFSQAAQINPKDPEIQNYLGITLSEKGLRGPAETALRKAVELNPNYGNAHANLAFIYITRKPPLLDLAKWHYEKAIAVGHPRNPAIEKLLDPEKTSASTTR
jgi:tetratricopeptide (TPR) repeat protein